MVMERQETEIRKCRVCGCTDDDCSQCIEAQGYPCYWVEYDLCSRCANQKNGEAFEVPEDLIGSDC